MIYYVINNGALLTSENQSVLERFYGNAQELPNDYVPNKYIVQKIEVEIPDESEEGYHTNIEYELVRNPNYEQEEAQKEYERVQNLKMTPLDFLKALEAFGITYETIKQIMDANPLVDREMRFCQNVYRKHPMITQFASIYGITDEQLDYIFKKANGEEV